jgi:hypothetical protein
MIVAVVIGPIVAVVIADRNRKNSESNERREHVFRSLMATRSSNLSPSHVESLNLVDVLFQDGTKHGNRVVDQWKLYLDHLNDTNYPRDSWGTKRHELLVELLYEMSGYLKYSFDKSHIKKGTYYPSGYSEAENETIETRKLWLSILRDERGLPMTARTTPPVDPFESPTSRGEQ